MSDEKTIGDTACLCCGRQVWVKKNRAGFAYYRCDAYQCGSEMRFHSPGGSAKFIADRVALCNVPAPPEPEKTGKKPEAAAVAAVAAVRKAPIKVDSMLTLLDAKS